MIGTRGSRLALAQTRIVTDRLAKVVPGVRYDIVVIKTGGDCDRERPLSEIGGSGLFARDIEHALAAGVIDCAVHSCKDLPPVLHDGCAIAAFLERGSRCDALVTNSSGVTLASLPEGAVVGTGSARRAAQAVAANPLIVVKDIRGNVPTRLEKLDRGEYDAIILAVAGLERLGLASRITQTLDEWYYSPGQGIIAVEARAGDDAIVEMLSPLDHIATRTEATAERLFLEKLGAGCRTPSGVRVSVSTDGTISFAAFLKRDDGEMRFVNGVGGIETAASMAGRLLA